MLPEVAFNPMVEMSRLVVSVKAREGRRARAGAPWLFSNEIAMTTALKGLPAGTVVNVVGDDGRSFGTGTFNAASLIAVRLYASACDVGLDRAFFAMRLQRALTLRQQLYAEPYYRLVHAEGDGLPGLVVDRFGDACVVQITTAGMEALRQPFLAALDDVVGPATVILRADAPARALEGLPSYMAVEKGDGGRLGVEENGVRYFADSAGGQKTGWYYDQRDNRAFLASLARGRSVLDAYCYTGGFALAAAMAGAREVAGLDSSAPALALAEDAARANALSANFIRADVFEELERLSSAHETFDVVAADPPPFVKSKKDLETGAKAYRKLARLAASVTAPGGVLMLASCSHNIPLERFAQECAMGLQRAGRAARLIRQAGAGPDHPVHPMLPETAYLKALFYALD
ncbi:MAG: class I SAM-dependent rRNA methyltransferase [Alphaproteobacteria bacterium]|nr:class I SAM-dependent rRNA methyltransferase [Alphaproteobacteria bacterium]